MTKTGTRRLVAGKFSLNLRENRLLRMLLAGLVNSLFGFGVFSLTLLAGMRTSLALLVGLACGTAFNFITTGGYVFRQLSLRLYPRFVASYLLIYVVNLGLIRLLSEITTNDIVSQAILTAPIALLSYFLMARFVFVPTRRTDPSGNPPDTRSTP